MYLEWLLSVGIPLGFLKKVRHKIRNPYLKTKFWMHNILSFFLILCARNNLDKT